MPTWQGEEFLERCLQMLARQQVDLDWDFLAIDSGSTDGTLEILRRARARFPVPLSVESIHQVEFDHGDTRNLLASRSSGDLLVFLTQDAIPSGPDWLATLAANFEDPRVGAAYCRNVARPDCEPVTAVLSAQDPGYATERQVVELPPADEYARMTPDERRLLYNFNDVASAVRRELWERHPFPRTQFGEDVLLARGLLEAGFQIVYDAEASVEHSHDYSAEETFKRAAVDGRFSAEWLDRICIASERDARTLAQRLAPDDERALQQAGFEGDELRRLAREAHARREAAFLGLHAGGKSAARHAPAALLDRPELDILFVVHGFPPDTWAGTEVYTLTLAKALQARGHQCTVLTRAPAAGDDAPEDFTVFEDEFEGLRVLRMVHRLDHPSLAESYDQPHAEQAFREVLLDLTRPGALPAPDPPVGRADARGQGARSADRPALPRLLGGLRAGAADSPRQRALRAQHGRRLPAVREGAAPRSDRAPVKARSSLRTPGRRLREQRGGRQTGIALAAALGGLRRHARTSAEGSRGLRGGRPAGQPEPLPAHEAARDPGL
ncbi:MAG: glycosyltransferase [Planctomycetota bacterium]